MCTLAVYRCVSEFYPLVVVANRDEFLGRATTAPSAWPGDASVVAGRDLVGGGTWLGCRTDGSGRVVGILNRRPAVDRAASGPGELSRGSLCIEALRAASLEAAVDGLDTSQAARYGGFNLFLADLRRSMVVDNGGGVRRLDLDTGLSVLTNLDVNDPRCPRLVGAAKRFGALTPVISGETDVAKIVAALAAVLASHDDGAQTDDVPSAGTDAASFAMDPTLSSTAAGSAIPFGRICVHAGDYGTRSSTILFVRPDGAVRYFHADGPPCTTAFREVETTPTS